MAASSTPGGTRSRKVLQVKTLLHRQAGGFEQPQPNLATCSAFNKRLSWNAP